MARIAIVCAFHETDRLLRLTLRRAVQVLTQPTIHDYEVLVVADRTPPSIVTRLIPELRAMGIDEFRIRATDTNAFSGAPSNNFHGHHFLTTVPYQISFTDDTFFHKQDPTFDVLDAIVGVFERNPDVAVLTKVDDHEEWDHPLTDIGEPIEPGVRSVNRVVDQFIAYDTTRFAQPADDHRAWETDTYRSTAEEEYQWENLVSRIGTSAGRRIAFPSAWPLRVRHCDLRLEPGSMHGTQNEDVKLECYRQLLATAGTRKRSRSDVGS